MIQEFKEFIAKGSAIDLAIGVVVGAAFGAIVKALVDSIIMPVVGLVLGGVDFSNLFIVLKVGEEAGPYETLVAAQDAGAVVLGYGVFMNAVVSFFIIAFVVFLVVKGINRLRKPQVADEQVMKECPFCLTSIPSAATRCSACTSELPSQEATATQSPWS